MKSSRICIALALCALAAAAGRSNTPLPSTASCSLFEGKTMTLRGKVSKVWDNAWLEDTDENALVLDPKETVFLLTLRKPICSPIDGKIMARPVNQREVTVVELKLPDGQDWSDFARHLGHTRTIEGTLTANVWWHYEASMQFLVNSVH